MIPTGENTGSRLEDAGPEQPVTAGASPAMTEAVVWRRMSTFPGLV